MVTLSDIAKHLGVSISTVSYSLNNDTRIPEATRQRVIEAAKALGYNGISGRAVRQNNFKQVVLCINSIMGGIYPEIVEAMTETLSLNNCYLTLYVGNDITKLKWLDGLFVLNSKVTNADITRINSMGVPVVLMDRENKIADVLNVTLDNFDGCRKTTQSAIDAGAHSFVFIGGPKESYESLYRFNGFTQALKENGLTDKNQLVLQTDFTYEGGLNACRFLIEREIIPDAIICANDETAMGIIAGLKAANYNRDIIVTGFDGVRKYNEATRFVTARADHKHWATTSSYSMLQMLQHSSSRSIKIPVRILEYNM